MTTRIHMLSAVLRSVPAVARSWRPFPVLRRVLLCLVLPLAAVRLPAQVQVTPDGDTWQAPANTTGLTAPFYINNQSFTGQTYTLVRECWGAVTSCSAPSSVFVNAMMTVVVDVTFSTGAPGTGTLRLQAYVPFAESDDGFYTVNAVSPSVAVTPDGATAPARQANTGGHSASFTVQNTGGAPDTYTLTCIGSASITCGTVTPSSVQLASTATAGVTVNYSTGAPGTGTLTLRASGSASDTGTYLVPILSGNVAVRAELPQRQHFAGTNASERFFVKNRADIAASYTLSYVCTGSATCSSVTPTSVTLNPGESSVATLSYTVGSAGAPGTAMLKAVDTSPNGARDSASVAVTSVGTAFPVVSVADVNPGTAVERDLCLTLAAGSDAASECGDLRILHPLAAIRTLNKSRVPTLLYNSAHADPYPVVAANVTLAGPGLPDSVEAVLFIGGAEKTRARWAGTDWSPGATRRIALGSATLSDTTLSADTTRVLDYTLELATIVNGGPRNASTVAGKLIVVNRRRAGFGAGWWLAGLERLSNLADGSKLWTGGDGSARVYAPAGTNMWVAAKLERPDTLKWSSSEFLFVRALPGGVKVKFNLNGQHVLTVNRLSHTTSFAYTSGLLTAITLPSQGGGQVYTFAYDSTSPPLRKVTVTAPGSRATRVWLNAMRVDSIEDPDGRVVRFSYESASSRRIMTRTDRRQTGVTYNYDAAKKLWRAHLNLQPDSIRLGFRALDAQGLATASPKTATDTASVYTAFFGARHFAAGGNYVAQETKFWLDARGTPRRIVNPLGHETLIRREDGEWETAVTELRAPNGFLTRARHDGRGNAIANVAVNPLGDGRDAITRVGWDSRWDFVTKLVRPERDSVVIAYDTMNGNRLWQQDGRGQPSRVTFNYDNSPKLLSSIVYPGGARDSLTYSALGNLASALTPRQFLTTYVQDALGRDTTVLSPIDTLGSYRQKHRTRYDVMDRVDTAMTIGPEMWSASEGITIAAETLYVRNTYDQEGNLKSVARWPRPDAENIGSITTAWDYDGAGRPVRMVPYSSVESHGDSTVYDPAGNAVKVITRRGDTLTMEYDALNRLQKRRLPRFSYAARQEGIAYHTIDFGDGRPPYPYYPNDTGGRYTIFSDSAVFDYDEMGNLTRADNGDAHIRRRYYANGLLKVDTVAIRTVYGQDFTTHRHRFELAYDLNGRRVRLTHPTDIGPSGLAFTDYAYDPLTGTLAMVTDPVGNQFRYHYNLRGEVDTLYLPSQSGVTQSFAYDSAGNLVGQRATNAGLSQYKHSEDYLRVATFRRDARGKLLYVADSSGAKDTLTAFYSGLGNMMKSALVSHGWNTDPPGPARSRAVELADHDALANLRGRRDSVWIDQSWSLTDQFFEYASGTGRLVSIADSPTESADDTLHYDLAGNVVFSTTKPAQGKTMTDRASYYAGDGTLRAADSRTVSSYGNWEAVNNYHTTFEEYRYDALGRRVLIRARRWCNDTAVPRMCRHDKVRRTVWDGDRELYEIQMPGDSSSPYLESDTAHVNLQVDAGDGDPNPFFGRVAYTYGLALDQPLSVIRMGYADASDSYQNPRLHRTLGAFAIFPVWKAERGQPQVGVFAEGGLKKCEMFDGYNRCVRIGWIEMRLGYLRPKLTYDFWHGSLIEDKRDEGGTFFRRNRYYDPMTGRFTQEDPIGLAGGLNLYGFANGDPVNFSDPFGLQACDPPDKPCPGPTPSELRSVVNDLAAQADATEQAIEILAAVTVAPAAVVLAADAAGAAVTGQAARTFAQGARQKIADLAQRAHIALENSNVGSYVTGLVMGGARGATSGGGHLPAPYMVNPNFAKGFRHGETTVKLGKVGLKILFGM